MPAMASPIPEWQNPDQQTFEREILASRRPAVLRGVASHWPLVHKGLASASEAMIYLQMLNPGTEVEYLHGDPAIGGRYFYNDTLTGDNFRRARAPFGHVMGLLREALGQAAPPALSMQAFSAPVHLPQLDTDNRVQFPPLGTPPTVWIGNAGVVAPHNDGRENVACVAVGRRRFTLFPPEQLENLYIGPLHATPQGVPVSLVDVANPDYERFPKYAQAWEAAQVAELGPGDAVFIPYMWWHSVRSLEPFNVLVNYWWSTVPRANSEPFTALMHAILAVGSLPDEQREVWRRYFSHFVFREQGDPAACIPEAARGVLGSLPPQQFEQMMSKLIQVLVAERPAATQRQLAALFMPQR
jgi:hypothetical protein